MAAYSQEYDFETGVTQSMTLYGRMYDNGGLDRTFDKTGWDVESGISMDAEGNRVTGDTYGPLYGVDDGGNGKAVITLNNAGTIVNGFALDVSKPIYLSYGVSLVDNMAEWITFALTDTLGGAYLSGGSDALTNIPRNVVCIYAPFSHATGKYGAYVERKSFQQCVDHARYQ